MKTFVIVVEHAHTHAHAHARTHTHTHLFVKQLETLVMQRHHLHTQYPRLQKPLAQEHIFTDQRHIRSNHRTRSEERFEVLWQLCPPRISRVHCHEHTTRRYQTDRLTNEVESPHNHGWLALGQSSILRLTIGGIGQQSNGIEKDLHLGGNHRQYLDVDAVKFVETSPGPRLSKALEKTVESLEAHLLGAIEDVARQAERAGQVFRCLGFTCVYVCVCACVR